MGINFFKNHFIDILKVLNAFRDSTKKQESAEAKVWPYSLLSLKLS
jgi:hypothetical protein